MKHLALFFCLFIVGCVKIQQMVELAGRKFCVPRKHITPDVPWVKVDGRVVGESNDLAMFNCFTIKLENGSLSRSNCLFQPEISTFLIAEDDGSRFGSGSPGYEGSTIGMVLTANDTTHTITDEGRLLVIENPRIIRNRFIWSRNEGLFSPGDKPIAGKDELLASCHNATTGIDAPPGLSRPMISCRRKFLAGRISISYSFESTAFAPALETVSRFDQAIVDWLTQAECKNNPAALNE